SSTRTLVLQDAEVPVENLLGEQGRGHIIAFNILNVGRYKLAIGSVGGAKRSLQLSAEYVTERKQFDTAISDFTLTQERSEEHTSELQSRFDLVCRLLLEKKN